MGRNWAKYGMKQAMLIWQGYRCSICGGQIKSHRGANFDHVWPLSLGGYDGPGNVAMAHRPCNLKKGNRLPTGCEIIWLCAINARGGFPLRLKEDVPCHG